MDLRIVIAAIIVLVIITVWLVVDQHRLLYMLQLKSIPAMYRKWYMADYENATAAAELLARVNSKMVSFLRFMKKKYHIGETDDVIQQEGAVHDAIINLPDNVHQIVEALLTNYNPDAFYENDPRSSHDTAYTLGKGRQTFICLRDRSNPQKLVDEDLLFFVLLHEASHMANKKYGHDTEFWTIFKFLLREAHLAGVYQPHDYSRAPTVYCGLKLDYNPYFDTSLPTLGIV